MPWHSWLTGGRFFFAGQFETVFSTSAQKIKSHNDFAALSDTDKVSFGISSLP